MSVEILVELAETEYPTFQEMMPIEDGLPAKFADWRRYLDHERYEIEVKRGDVVRMQPVSLAAFRAYLQKNTPMRPTGTALRSCAKGLAG